MKKLWMMIKVNEYFDGKVKSLTIEMNGNNATSGVMAKGKYEFGTDLKEIMTISYGEVRVKLPGQPEWQAFKTSSRFEVPANSKFQIEVIKDTAYLCEYVPA